MLLTAIMRELRGVIEFDGSYVNYRHLPFLCNLMAHPWLQPKLTKCIYPAQLRSSVTFSGATSPFGTSPYATSPFLDCPRSATSPTLADVSGSQSYLSGLLTNKSAVLSDVAKLFANITSIHALITIFKPSIPHGIALNAQTLSTHTTGPQHVHRPC